MLVLGFGGLPWTQGVLLTVEAHPGAAEAHPETVEACYKPRKISKSIRNPVIAV
jgi:hypothetical protein